MRKAETGVMQVQTKECQRLLANYQKLGGNKEGFPNSSQKEVNPANTLIWDFFSLELWNNTFLLF